MKWKLSVGFLLLTVTSCTSAAGIIVDMFADGVYQFPHEPAGPSVGDRQETIDKMGDKVEEAENGPTGPIVELPEPVVVEPKPVLEPEPEPRIIRGDFDNGGNSNLWKPVSDTEGTVVVLFDKMYAQQFDGCKIDGRSLECRKWSDEKKKWVPNCFANGARQHWRLNKKCHEVTKKEVTCKLGKDTYIFTGKTGVCEREE